MDRTASLPNQASLITNYWAVGGATGLHMYLLIGSLDIANELSYDI